MIQTYYVSEMYLIRAEVVLRGATPPRCYTFRLMLIELELASLACY
jgi:hypothetical protein